MTQTAVDLDPEVLPYNLLRAHLRDGALQTPPGRGKRVLQVAQVHRLAEQGDGLRDVDIRQQLRRRQRPPHELDLQISGWLMSEHERPERLFISSI